MGLVQLNIFHSNFSTLLWSYYQSSKFTKRSFFGLFKSRDRTIIYYDRHSLGCLFFTDLLIMKLAVDNNRKKVTPITYNIYIYIYIYIYIFIYLYIVEPAKLNNFSFPSTSPLKINGRLPGYIEHLSTLNIEHQILACRTYLTCLHWVSWTDLKLFTADQKFIQNMLNDRNMD